MTNLSSARCLVLGGGGFLGINLCRHLSGKVAHLRAFGRRSRPAGIPADIEWLCGDFGDAEAMSAAVQGCNVVFHLVTTTTPASANLDKAADMRTNVGGTLNMLDASLRAGVSRVIFVSSGGTVYGIPSVLPTPEDASTFPITAYGISKLAIERYLHLYEYAHGLSYRVLRVANPFGAHQTGVNGQGVIGMFIQSILGGRPIEIFGDGSAVRDYVYVDDVVLALQAAASYEGTERIFNIGSGEGKSLLEVVASIELASGVRSEIRFRDGRRLDVPASVLDIRRAARELHWQPRWEYDHAIAETVRWVRARAA